MGALVIDPQHPRIVYAGTEGAGLYKSLNGGRDWRPLSIAPETDRVDAIALDPAHAGTLYVGTGVGIFKSIDGGKSWRPANAGLLDKYFERDRGIHINEGYVTQLVVNPKSPKTVYARTESFFGCCLFKSTDGGGSWQRLHLSPARKAGVAALALDPSDPDTVYAGAAVGKGRGWTEFLFKSTDGGASWEHFGLPSSKVGTVVVDPQEPRTVFVGTDKGIFKSVDGGKSWRAAGLAAKDKYISFLLVDPQDSQRLYAVADGGAGGLFTSRDGGASWQAIRRKAASIAVSFEKGSPATLYAGDVSGIVKSTDGGASWRGMNSGLNGARITTLGVYPPAGIAYASIDETRTVYVERTNGSRRAVSPARAGAGGLRIHTVTGDPRDPSTVYAITNRGILGSGRHGWHTLADYPAPSDEKGGVVALAVDPHDSLTIYAITDNVGIIKSTNGGASWQVLGGINANEDRAAFAFDPLDRQAVYVGDEDGLFKTVDGGRTWRSAGFDGRFVYGLAFDWASPTSIYAGTDRGLFRSTNGGASWQALSPLPESARVKSVVFYPEPTLTIFAGTDVGVFMSSDDAHSWQRVGRGLPVRTYDALALDPAGILYAGSNGSGIFVLDLARSRR